LLAEAGFRWIRQDLTWSSVETKPNVYNFDELDQLILKTLLPNKLRAILILDYFNPLYDNNTAVHTEGGRKAFCAFAYACIERYRGNGFIWEIYNEPNLDMFWPPKANVTDYARLVHAIGKYVKQAFPDEFLVGPGTSQIDFNYVEQAFQLGILEVVDAVSIHPYRSLSPETTIADYKRMRYLIHKYLPREKERMDLIVSEWGYSELYPSLNIHKQGKYVARMQLVNLASDIRLTINYDWKNDCEDPKNLECFFGTVGYTYYPGRYVCCC
jgi:hypothetical protein